MIKVKLAKSLMENEEGTNHLLIKILSPVPLAAKKVRIDIRLPNGVSRLNNLNGYYEDKSGTIFIDDFSKGHDLVIEIFTEKPTPCCEGNITIDLKYKDKQDQIKMINQCISLAIVSEDKMDNLAIDNEVIERTKNLLNGFICNEEIGECEFVIVPPTIQNVNNQISDLEKKYRVDFNVNSELMWR
jgi:hypothetical protein